MFYYESIKLNSLKPRQMTKDIPYLGRLGFQDRWEPAVIKHDFFLMFNCESTT